MRYKGQGATYYVIDSIQSEENVSSKMSKPQYMNQTLSLNGRKVVSLVTFALFTSFRLPTLIILCRLFFFFFFPHIIISMLQEGLSSRSCSIDPTYQTSLTYCFFQRNRFHICNCYSMHVGKSISVWLDLFSFSKEFILSYMATNYWVSDLRIGYAVKTFCSSSSSCFVCLFVFFFCFFFFFFFGLVCWMVCVEENLASYPMSLWWYWSLF